MKPVIEVENLGKKYVIAHKQKEQHDNIRDKISGSISRMGRKIIHPFSGSKGPLLDYGDVEEFWALKDVNFSVNQGDKIGIIGRNGAGKSTLLKILSRITEPTEGKVILRGRVASLLEVGTGFHSELTGRENIYLNGSILGMTKIEIDKKFDEIVDFAGVEQFLDTPVKRYSSGMRVRLGFSVAAHLEPEILLIDEVLAVGDAEFQKKCLGKMDEIAKEGRTVLFISHNMGSIHHLCQRVLLLDNGFFLLDGDPDKVIQKYLQNYNNFQKFSYWKNEENLKESNDNFFIHEIKIVNCDNSVGKNINGSDPFTIEFKYSILQEFKNFRFGFIISNNHGTNIFDSYDNDYLELNDSRNIGIYLAKCYIPGQFLVPGEYLITIVARDAKIELDVCMKNILSFTINNIGSTFSKNPGKRVGIVTPKINWDTIKE